MLPSLPGYGFSGEPTELGWESGRIARAWAELMERLGYTRYVAQGGDVGASVTDAMGRQAPKGLIGIHLNLLAGALGIADKLPAKSEQERAAHNALATFRTSGFGYFLEQSTRPQTIGYSLLDSPVGLAAWLLDHDTDSYYKISRAFVDGKPVGNLTRESIVDNITLYWLTGTGASAARWYWEFGQFLAAAGAAGRLLRRSRFPSASRRSPARSGLPRAAGLRRSTPASPTSTRSTAADTSRHGKNRHSSRRSCARRSSRCGNAWSGGGRRATSGASSAALIHAATAKEVHMKTTRIMAVAVLIVGSGLALHVARAQQARNQAHRPPAARSQRPRTRGRPGARRARPGSGVLQAHASGRRDRLCPRRASLEYQVEGKPPVTLKAGDVLFIPAGTIHAAKNVGSRNGAELATYIVEKGKPLITEVSDRSPK